MKKSMLVLALVAMAAFAAPSMASAAEWTRDGEPLEEPGEMELSGWIQWSAGGGAIGYKCDVTGHATLWPGDKGAITKAAFPNCNGLYAMSGLTANGVAEQLSWSLQAQKNGRAATGNFVNYTAWKPGGAVENFSIHQCGAGVIEPNPDLSSSTISISVCTNTGLPSILTGVLKMSPEFGGTFDIG